MEFLALAEWCASVPIAVEKERGCGTPMCVKHRGPLDRQSHLVASYAPPNEPIVECWIVGRESRAEEIWVAEHGDARSDVCAEDRCTRREIATVRPANDADRLIRDKAALTAHRRTRQKITEFTTSGVSKVGTRKILASADTPPWIREEDGVARQGEGDGTHR
jgi:hypothetical protein